MLLDFYHSINDFVSMFKEIGMNFSILVVPLYTLGIILMFKICLEEFLFLQYFGRTGGIKVVNFLWKFDKNEQKAG